MEHVAFGTAFSAALAVAAIAFELRRETVALWRLAPAPLAALACALSLPPEPRWLGAAIGATVIGSVAGAVRGLSPAFRVDHQWKVMRLREVEIDGAMAALAIAVLAGADIAPVESWLVRHAGPAPFASIALLCAFYLTGRAITIFVRTRSTPHEDMLPQERNS